MPRFKIVVGTLVSICLVVSAGWGFSTLATQPSSATAFVVAVGAASGAFCLLFVTFYCLATESAKRHRVERALDQSQARFHAITDSTGDGIITTDAQGRITYANDPAGRMFFYDPEQLLGQPLSLLMPQPFAEAAPQGMRFAGGAEEGWIGKTMTTDGLRRGGTSFPVELCLAGWTSTDGPALIALIHDITSRQEIAETLQQSESRFRIVSELAVDYAYSFRVEPDGRALGEWVTDAFERITGYSLAEVEARGGGLSLVHPDDMPVVLRRLRNLFANQPDLSDYRIVTKDGATRWVRDRGMPVWDAKQQRIVRAYGAVQDITEQRQAQEQLQSRQEELAQVLRAATVGELSAGLAHEINQPLAAIVSYAKGCTRRLRTGVVAPDDLLRVVEEIATQALRADEIVRRLREYARKASPKREAVDINALVKTAVSLIAHESRQSGVDVDLSLTAELPNVIADGVQIEQVILSLMRNALETMNRSETKLSRVVIQTKAEPDESIGVSVSHPGEGFGSVDVERSFEPFFSNRPNGLGIGLSISRSIVEAHGGRLWAEAHDGEGVTMCFTLPVGSHDTDQIS